MVARHGAQILWGVMAVPLAFSEPSHELVRHTASHELMDMTHESWDSESPSRGTGLVQSNQHPLGQPDLRLKTGLGTSSCCSLLQTVMQTLHRCQSSSPPAPRAPRFGHSPTCGPHGNKVYTTVSRTQFRISYVRVIGGGGSNCNLGYYVVQGLQNS